MTSIHYTAARFDRAETHSFRTTAIQVLRHAAKALATFCIGLCEGFVAYRQYEHLKSWGVTHDTALRDVMQTRTQA